MKTFQQYLEEDFNSPKATQFKLPLVAPSKGKSAVSSSSDTVVFYERIMGQSLPIMRYIKSFQGSEVQTLMQSPSSDYRFAIFGKEGQFDIFAWKASVTHHTLAHSLDQNKEKRYPNNRYLRIYNESLMLDPSDTLNEWCFSFVLFENKFISNINKQGLMVFENKKQISNIFKFTSAQWMSLLNKQECNLN